MCGIGLIVSKQRVSAEIIERVHNLQHHRGPDAQVAEQLTVGEWHVSLIHQRLSILDLSSAGNQPMQSKDGTGWLIYNGEIYNFIEIRAELEGLGCCFTGHSDTEVLLMALSRWGEEDTLRRLNGMFAFVWLDERKGRLILARDRFGVKPLYCYESNDGLICASEIKTILGAEDRKFHINETVVNEYLVQFSIDTSNETFYRGINKMPAGTYSVIDLNREILSPVFKEYWQIDWAKLGVEATDDENTENIRSIFYDAVRVRLRSDVPVGILLSGGVDSSVIAAAVHRLVGEGANINLLAAVSNDPVFDESPFIDMMAQHLGKEVHKVNLSFELNEAQSYLEKVTWYNDEPCGGFSNVAQYLLMKRARELGVKVLLSGQGADEAFCGYSKYLGFYLISLLRQNKYVKAVRLLYVFLKNDAVIKQFNWGNAKRYFPKLMQLQRKDTRGDRLRQFKVPLGIGMTTADSVAKRQWLDVCKYSIPVLTHYEDRMSMAHSCEVRHPFLDYRLIEAALCLPIDMKLSKGWTKYVLRKAMEIDMPPEVIWRKDKKGFSNPESEWLKLSFSELITDYFGEEALIFKTGLVKRKELMELYEAYRQQPSNKGAVSFREIWVPMSLEIWLRQFKSHLYL